MVSRTALICSHYKAGYIKNSRKILRVKRGQKERNAPEIVRERRNRVRFGCWRGWERLETGANGWENPESEPKRTPFPCNTCKKKTGRNPEFPPVLWQGQKDLSRLPPRVLLPSGERPAPTEAAAETGSQQSATGARSPLGTRFWSGCGRAHQGARKEQCFPVLRASQKTSGADLMLQAKFR